MSSLDTDYDKDYCINIYKEINTKIWKEFEEGKITSDDLKIERFQRLIDKLNLSKLILILFSRTNNFNTLKFAITFSRQFKINKFFNRLFKDIESLALNSYLTAFCFIALSNHNNSNAIYRKTFYYFLILPINKIFI